MRNFYDPEDKYSWVTGMVIAVILSMIVAAAITIVWCFQHNEPRKAPNEERSQKLAEMPILKINRPQLAPPRTFMMKTEDGWIEEEYLE